MKDWMTYEKIQELKRNHLNKSQVSRRLHVDYKTVTKYWDMPPDEFSACKNRAQRRKKRADAYKDFIVGCLQQFPDMTAAQVYDWIKERTGLKKLPFRKRSFRNYVAAIREEYGIPKVKNARQYEAVDDPPLGKQAQVDMGEIILKTPSGRSRKVYGFGIVLSNSRYKYVLWQTHTAGQGTRAHRVRKLLAHRAREEPAPPAWKAGTLAIYATHAYPGVNRTRNALVSRARNEPPIRESKSRALTSWPHPIIVFLFFYHCPEADGGNRTRISALATPCTGLCTTPAGGRGKCLLPSWAIWPCRTPGGI